MITGHLQGQFLRFCVSLSGAERVLELGTFTGYSALCFASTEQVRRVVTIDSDINAVTVAKRLIDQSDFSPKIDLRQGKAKDVLTSLLDAEEEPFDIIYIDCDK